ncbi:hypothetical protein L1987_77347 [Smallanthus sonchifolius]|uniref:Uncharacterized protein n=1 Tax=Smallanthus sonchifolius TaxID=185202 RepID=A0ACB8Z9A7_9ASTR|nr:hypothetical protein L1987_77347 [Smallanthus sonchifolius]
MVREQNIESFYCKLRESALNSASNTPLLIFPSTSDVDSLCALKIICHILESDLVRYACYPVSSFKEINKYAGPSLSTSNDDPVTILLINWGCHRDLRKILEVGPVSRVFVLDSHRPIHLHNLSHQNDRVVVLYTRDDENQAELSYDFDVSALAAASDLNSDDEMEEDESDSEYENESDDDDDDGNVDMKRRRVSQDDETDLTSVTLKDGTIVSAPDASRIAYEDEPKLMLLQEWNLFDSMLCSSYMATKLKTWSDNGAKKLMLLLAQMGFALEECKQKFHFMSVEIKNKMKDEFEHFLPDYDLNDFYYRGFLLLHGYSSKVSAADVVYGVTALLESSVDSNSLCASKQFGEAYDALSSRKLRKLETGMRHAIKIQRAILRQGSTAITRKGSIRSGRKFRWVKLEDSSDAKLLGYPQALTKFGNAAEETGAEFFHELFESSWIFWKPLL